MKYVISLNTGLNIDIKHTRYKIYTGYVGLLIKKSVNCLSLDINHNINWKNLDPSKKDELSLNVSSFKSGS